MSRVRRRLAQSAENALEVVRLGRLGPAYAAPYEIVERHEHGRLRRYGARSPDASSSPLLLIPPLMLTAEIYDVEPDLSAVGALGRAGVDAWVVDFGAPEREEGGLRRTLDDHVRMVSRCIDRVRAITGRDVHLCGYSQGGMFAYQAAALRRSKDVASVITFGSPVDIHRSLPSVRSDLTALLIRALEPVVSRPLDRIEGLPGALTSTGFKLLTPRKEVAQLVDFVRKLHDRHALEARERRRRFLGGEGFVAWPAPALRAFIDEFIVHNRMLSGGFVVDGRTVTLADITCPVLCFVGTRDDIAREPAVRAIRRAAPLAEVHEVDLAAGHFGLVVGSRAMAESWPTVAGWLAWRDGGGPRPAALDPPRSTTLDDEPEEAAFDVDPEIELVRTVVGDSVRRAWRKLADVATDASTSIASARWQVPRLRELERLRPETLVSPSRALAARAREMPTATFFLWRGRAFSYAEADRRVDHVVRGLFACGVRREQRVAVVMAGRPSFLSMVTALNRLGAVAVLVSPEAERDVFTRIVAAARVDVVATDPEHAAACRAVFHGAVLVLGGAPERRGSGDSLPDGVTDMEAIDPERIELPASHTPDDGRAADLAMILASGAGGREPLLSPITNQRWAFSALGAAAACTLTPDDTVYACLPLHHPAGVLVAVGSALAGGSRLALATRFDPDAFWPEVRRYGATVVFYAGEMLRPLVHAPPAPHERDQPIRLFAGSGMRADLWERLVARFGAGVLEFYASTSQNLVLANASGSKVASLGRPLPGSVEIAIVRADPRSGEPLRGANGRVVPCAVDEPGLVIGRLERGAPEPLRGRLLRDALEPNDRWFLSGDLLRRDADGDYWFDGRARSLVRTAGGPVSTWKVEDALYRSSEIELAAAYAVPSEGAGPPRIGATVVTKRDLDKSRLMHDLAAHLPAHALPAFVRCVRSLPLTDGFQPIHAAARAAIDGAPDLDSP